MATVFPTEGMRGVLPHQQLKICSLVPPPEKVLSVDSPHVITQYKLHF